MTKDEKTAKCQAARTAATGAGGSFSATEWNALKARYGFRCVHCLEHVSKARLVPDHVVPVCDGGTSDIGNIQPLCKRCNGLKWRRDFDYRLTFGQRVWGKIVMSSLTPPDDQIIKPGDVYIIIEGNQYKLSWLAEHFSLRWVCSLRVYEDSDQQDIGHVEVPFAHCAYPAWVALSACE